MRAPFLLSGLTAVDGKRIIMRMAATEATECWICNSTMDWEGEIPDEESDVICHHCETDRLRSDVEKYYIKSRVYGAIACRFREALEQIANWDMLNPPNPTTLADGQWLNGIVRDALQWRHSERSGVPMSAIEVTDVLLRAQEENERLKEALRRGFNCFECGKPLDNTVVVHRHTSGPCEDYLTGPDIGVYLDRWDGLLQATNKADAYRKALEAIANDPHQGYTSGHEQTEAYRMGVADGHRCAGQRAREALGE